MNEDQNANTGIESHEGLVEATVVRWREKRGEGWSDTLYTGMSTTIDGVPVLISKLSHGLRVLPRKDDTEYQFEGAGVTVHVSEALIISAKAAFHADREFQKRLAEYELLLTNS